MKTSSTLATFGSGCFWCTEAIFRDIRGVIKVTSGYAGGHRDNPTYEDVCNGTTGHAEVVQIEFDPSEISYEQILKIFFTTHNPTTLNRQGNDVGTQYRSVIFYHSEEQKVIAEKVMQQLQADKLFADPIVTTIEPFQKFYPAEDYHQDYYARNPQAGYCQAVINPKLSKFRQQYASLLKQ